MHDPRFDKLAKLLVEYSTRLKRNENVLIEAFDVPDEMTVALIRAVRKAGAITFVQVQRSRISRELAIAGTDEEDAGLYRTPRKQQHQRIVGCAGGENAARGQEDAAGSGPARQKNQVVRFAMAHPLHGTACGNEHGGVRGLLFQSLHARLRETPAGNEGT